MSKLYVPQASSRVSKKAELTISKKKYKTKF